jgi:aspartyl-tRNA synthetase
MSVSIIPPVRVGAVPRAFDKPNPARIHQQSPPTDNDSRTTGDDEIVNYLQELSSISDISRLPVGSRISFRARIHTQRRVSSMLDFVLFRDQTHSIQGVLERKDKEMVKWVQHLPHESLVQVTGVLQEPVEPVRSSTFSEKEVAIWSIFLVSPARSLPFDNYKPPEAMRQRLTNRVLDLRHPSNQALFRIRNRILREWRNVLEDMDFIEINTPKLQGAATESGASVFKVNYFGRDAFLAQSPQLGKQMAISADFGRVFEASLFFPPSCATT